jgi:hypothetical protein
MTKAADLDGSLRWALEASKADAGRVSVRPLADEPARDPRSLRRSRTSGVSHSVGFVHAMIPSPRHRRGGVRAMA